MTNKIEELKSQAGLYTDTSGRWANADRIDTYTELLTKEVFNWVVGNVGLMGEDELSALNKHLGLKAK